MESLGAILIVLIILLLLVGVISLIALIIMAIAKKKIKVPSIITGVSFGSAIFLFVVMVIVGIIATSGDSNTNTAKDSEPPRSSAEANNETPTKPKTSATADDEEEDTESVDESEEESTDLETEELDIENTEEVTEEVDEETPEVDPEDLSNYRTDYDIKDVERNPAEYKDELLSFEGKIIQVMEDDVYTAYRIAINDDYDRIAYVQTLSLTLEERLLEDDYVTVYGAFDDLLTYETVLGANQTVPAFIAHGERIILNEY